PVSQTFHGRDIFAPVAAHLAAGVLPSRIGKVIDDYLRPAFQQPVQVGKRMWNGQVLKADRFGNLVTNYHVDDFPDLGRRSFSFGVGTLQVEALARSYAETSPGEVFAILGSSGYYEISVREASAARATGCGSGSPIELTIY